MPFFLKYRPFSARLRNLALLLRFASLSCGFSPPPLPSPKPRYRTCFRLMLRASVAPMSQMLSRRARRPAKTTKMAGLPRSGPARLAESCRSLESCALLPALLTQRHWTCAMIVINSCTCLLRSAATIESPSSSRWHRYVHSPTTLACHVRKRALYVCHLLCEQQFLFCEGLYIVHARLNASLLCPAEVRGSPAG